MTICTITIYFMWAIFALDYLIQVKLSPNKKAYFGAHILELLLDIVPFLRPLRALRALVFTTQAGIRISTPPWMPCGGVL